MPYTKTNWVDEVLAAAQSFKILKPGGTGVDNVTDLANCLIELYPTITTPGTELSAENLNKIEQAIYDLFVEVETVVSDDTLLSWSILADTEAWVVGNGKFYWTVPPELNGGVIIGTSIVAGQLPRAYCMTPSTSGTPQVQIRRGRRENPTSTPAWANIMSSAITIDINEYSSTNGATPGVVNTANDDLTTGDVLSFDIATAGTGTKGLQVSLVIRK